jgi:S-adenosylmethionine-diacylglycerol 3-amino-3-carboxypropyl transferase
MSCVSFRQKKPNENRSHGTWNCCDEFESGLPNVSMIAPSLLCHKSRLGTSQFSECEVKLVAIASSTKRATAACLNQAVLRSKALSMSGIRERIFAAAFQGMVYPQIWEDPVVDMEALAIQPDDHIVAIASGGCNILSYLTGNPARITALDLSHAHIALNRLKLVAARVLPSYWHFANFFVHADLSCNIALFDEYIAPQLDNESLRYWQERDMFGRRRITAFARGFYQTGLLGRFIGATHLMGKALGVNVRAISLATSVEEQREIFDKSIAPVFNHWLLRWVLKNPASLYGLGIPPAQFAALAGGQEMSSVLRERVEKLACNFSMKENYFARQAFGRGYCASEGGSLPPYLEAKNFDMVRARSNCVDVRHESITQYLSRSPDRSVDAFVLLDAQDWMNTQQLTELWREIHRSAAPGARVIFRTAANERLLQGRIPNEIITAWTYHEARSKALNARDRSSIYGGFHLYTLNAAA